jgi:hypothetical protein
MRDALDHALDYHARGLNVLEIPPPGGDYDGKTPVRGSQWADLQSRHQTPDEIRARFTRPANVAIVTGGAVSGVVVVDADSTEAIRWCVLRLPRTPWQVRTAKGWHLYYRAADVPVRNRARIDTGEGRLALDVRGDGGYVIAPPSLHASGARYTLAGDWTQPREALPRFWPGWLARPKREVKAKHASDLPRPTGDIGQVSKEFEDFHFLSFLGQQAQIVAERARRYLAAIPRPEIGQGSDNAVLYAACKLLRGFALDAGTSEALLWEWAGGRPGWTREWIARKVQSAEKYGTEPIGALR